MSHHDQAERKRLRYRFELVLLAFLAIAAFLLFSEHRAHVLGGALWLLILACPILHLFMHAGHGAHRSRNTGRASEERRSEHQH